MIKRCADCRALFDSDSTLRRGRVIRCEPCRQKRNQRRHELEAGNAEKNYHGNGRDKATAVCPVCGEPRRVDRLCRCEIQLSPEMLEADYQMRYGV